ncbi:uncharacterized protein LOC125652804 isoform X1 [Ostrea edulis]|uniref:uncharacterized protein LOC125652804 isoform X1 n=1 Tax=Ostrea edulis TaxID=37623 RepID=UPI0024AF47F0|nr:uncharacterized protein LOC125652804 isoform X1 [Ostrea edulis]
MGNADVKRQTASIPSKTVEVESVSLFSPVTWVVDEGQGYEVGSVPHHAKWHFGNIVGRSTKATITLRHEKLPAVRFFYTDIIIFMKQKRTCHEKVFPLISFLYWRRELGLRILERESYCIIEGVWETRQLYLMMNNERCPS